MGISCLTCLDSRPRPPLLASNPPRPSKPNCTWRFASKRMSDRFSPFPFGRESLNRPIGLVSTNEMIEDRKLDHLVLIEMSKKRQPRRRRDHSLHLNRQVEVATRVQPMCDVSCRVLFSYRASTAIILTTFCGRRRLCISFAYAWWPHF